MVKENYLSTQPAAANNNIASGKNECGKRKSKQLGTSWSDAMPADHTESTATSTRGWSHSIASIVSPNPMLAGTRMGYR